MNKKNVVFPYPQAIEPGEWEISPVSGGAVDLVNKKMWVPLSPSNKDYNIRVHEMGHTKWSERGSVVDICKRERVSDSSFQAAEDMRINHLLRSTIPDFSVPTENVESLPYYPPYKQLLALIAWWESTDRGTIAKMVSPKVVVYGYIAIEQTHKRYDYTETSFAIQLARYLDAFNKKEGGEKGGEEPTNREEKDTTISWGEMTVVQPQLDVVMHNKKISLLRKVSRDEGMTIRNIGRYCADQRIFSSPIRRKEIGGTILIDVSGSMGLSIEDIDHIITERPLSTISLYSGEGEEGELVIIASHGKRINNTRIETFKKNGNIIDGPALEWLSQQAQPRWWVCDGYVTGVGDMSHPLLILEAQHITKKGKIIQLRNIREAIKIK